MKGQKWIGFRDPAGACRLFRTVVVKRQGKEVSETSEVAHREVLAWGPDGCDLGKENLAREMVRPFFAGVLASWAESWVRKSFIDELRADHWQIDASRLLRDTLALVHACMLEIAGPRVTIETGPLTTVEEEVPF